MAKKKNDGRAPATPAVPDPPVPNRAWTEMQIDPAPRDERCDPAVRNEKNDKK